MNQRCTPEADTPLDTLITAARGCRICVDQPDKGRVLGHEPRPVFQLSNTARICIAGQAPGVRAHESGIPFSDPSGIRLRQWLGMDETVFYDASRVAILPMGFCFPGLDVRGADLPPRPECARTWHARLLAELSDLRLLVLVGGYAQRWHLPRLQVPDALSRLNVNETVLHWREVQASTGRLRCMVVPHPSWRNTSWLNRHPWFETQLLPELRQAVAACL